MTISSFCYMQNLQISNFLKFGYYNKILTVNEKNDNGKAMPAWFITWFHKKNRKVFAQNLSNIEAAFMYLDFRYEIML